MTRLIRCWLLASLVLGFSSNAYGQPTVDPRIAEFNPSPDHSALDNGVPIVARYDLEFYLIGGAQPVRVLALGKPAPDPDGVIRVDFTALLNPPLAAGITHEARVVAVGPGGSGRSTPSNTFLFQAGTCSYSVTPTSRSVPVGGGTSTFSVATTAGCSWTAASQAGWITVTSGASGSGNGTVSFSAAANTGPARSGTILIANQQVTVTQVAGSTCTYAISPMTPTVARAGGTVTISVTSPSGCTWSASETPNVAWVTITSGSTGTGNGTVTLQVSATGQSTARTMTLTVAGRTLTLTQGGAALTTPRGLRIVP